VEAGHPDHPVAAGRRLARAEARFGPFAVVLAYFLPVPSVLVYAAVGEHARAAGYPVPAARATMSSSRATWAT
jgi:hypothetical protein